MGIEDGVETHKSNCGAYCLAEDPNCDWERFCDSEEIAKVLMTCHMVVKHPERYAFRTGNNPYEARRRYKQMIDACRRYL